MSGWRGYELTIGMQHMVPNRLSEVELLKWLGAYQWEATLRGALGRARERDRARSVAQGDRLYASFVDVELGFPNGAPARRGRRGHAAPHQQPGPSPTRGRASSRASSPASTPEPIARIATLAAVASRTDLEALPHPWASLTTAFVARAGSNSRLTVFEPVGMDTASMPVAEDRLVGIGEHQAALSTGQALPSFAGADALPPLAPGGHEVLYEILPESDLNGAGLLYFARYVAIMNYAERVFLSERLERPLSRQLVECLAVERRRVFYFTNADAGDRVRVFVDAAFVPPTSLVGPGKRRSLGKLVLVVSISTAPPTARPVASSAVSKSISVSGQGARRHQRGRSRLAQRLAKRAPDTLPHAGSSPLISFATSSASRFESFGRPACSERWVASMKSDGSIPSMSLRSTIGAPVFAVDLGERGVQPGRGPPASAAPSRCCAAPSRAMT